MNGRPRFASAYRELALVAAHVRDNRATGDPKLVASGKMTEADAVLRLRVASAIATDWRHIADMHLPPIEGATDAEKLACLQSALAGTTVRADRARQAIVSEWGERFLERSREELWALVDAHDAATARIAPYLHHESCAGAIEAMLWWQQRTGQDSIRFLVSVNIALRSQRVPQPERAAA